MENPSAFPHVNPNFDGNWDKNPQRSGMTLRDYFAGQAMLSDELLYSRNASYEQQMLERARSAYKYADAMLQARKDT